MKYKNTVKGRFQSRPNRFIAQVEIDGAVETVHVKNTGRCRELLLPGAEVILQISDNPQRKTKYDLITVWKEGLGWVNIDSQAPNRVVYEWLEEKENPVFQEIKLIKPEYRYGDSRIDFYLETEDKKVLMEVKGCTLEIDGTGYFPDAPTERGVKHLKELTGAAVHGYECYIAFVMAMPEVERVEPNRSTHREFAEALEEAVAAGVRILYLGCEVKEDEIWVDRSTIG